jgi:trypsin-like peptidase
LLLVALSSASQAERDCRDAPPNPRLVLTARRASQARHGAPQHTRSRWADFHDGNGDAMDSDRATRLYAIHSNAVAYIDVEDATGGRGIGTAFHVGDGIFVTARHVVDQRRILEVRITEPVGIRAAELFPNMAPEKVEEWDKELEKVTGFMPLYKHWTSPLVVTQGPLFHERADVDVAVFRVANAHPAIGVVLLGVHWDDWIYQGHWHLQDALILGYPPIPMTAEPHLVAARAEVNTYVVPRHSHQVHFIVSALARGGFSGGPALHEDGYALGVVTSSLLEGNKPPESGFMAVLSVEPIRLLLEQHGMLPACQAQFHDAFMHNAGSRKRLRELVEDFHRAQR